MDIVQNFIKEQFNDDDDFGYNEPKEEKTSREVSNLKKELEELKFYQELERTEYEDMKRKVYDMENSKKKRVNTKKRTSNPTTFTEPAETTTLDGSKESNDDVFDSLSNASNGKSTLVAKLKEKEQEIARLQKKFKSETDPKEFGKRMHKLEKTKNEEIEEIKKHYKGLMEQLAKQIQKSTERYDDEIKKNMGLRETMEEMRQDMAAREQDLEEKLLEMEAVLKKSENECYKSEQKLLMAEENLANNQVKLSAATEIKEEAEKRMRELEEDFEDERREMIHTFENGKGLVRREHTKIEEEFKVELQNLREHLSEVSEKLQIEKEAHEESVARMKEAQALVQRKGSEFEEKCREAKDAEKDANIQKNKVEIKLTKVEKECERKLEESSKKVKKLMEEKIALKEALKEADAKAFAADKKADLMSDSTAQKSGALRRKNSELEQVQLELRQLCDRHIKDIKFRDLQFVRERKKWHAIEQAMKKEIEDLKASPAYQRALLSRTPNILSEQANDEQLREMVEDLRGEKNSLLLQITNMKERNNKDTRRFQERIQTLESGEAKEEPLYANVNRSISTFGNAGKSQKSVNSMGLGTSTRSIPVRPSSFRYVKAGTSSASASTTSSSRPESPEEPSVSSNSSKIETVKAPAAKLDRSMMNTTAYRRQLRQRKFTKKANE